MDGKGFTEKYRVYQMYVFIRLHFLRQDNHVVIRLYFLRQKNHVVIRLHALRQ